MDSATSRRSVILIAACCLAAMGEGFNLQAPGVTLPVLAPLFGLSSGEGGGFAAGFFSSRSLFLSASTFGLFFGALIGGRLSDVIGRKGVVSASVALVAVFSAATILCRNADALLWVRFATGLGLGGALSNLLTIVSEAAGPGRRNTAMGCLYASMPAGGVVVSLLSYQFGNPAHWAVIYVIGGLIPLLALPGLIRFAPAGVKSAAAATDRTPVGTVLFGDGRSTVTLVLWLCFLCALITQYVLLSWLPSLLIAKGLTRPDAALVQLAFNLLGAVGSVITGVLVDGSRRIWPVAVTFLAAIIFLFVLSGAPAVLGIAALLGALVGWTVSGSQMIAYSLAPAAYPGAMRGTGVGFAVAVGRIGATVGPLIAGSMLAAGAGVQGVLILISALMVVAGVTACWVTVESRRRLA